MPPENRATQAYKFFEKQSAEIMALPEFASRSMASKDPEAASELAGEVSALVLSKARQALRGSPANLVFEATCIGDAESLLESVDRLFGLPAGQALRTDKSAMAAIPARSQSFLSAWRFPDNSFVLASRTADDSFDLMGGALLASEPFKKALGPDGDGILERAKMAGWGASAAFPLSADRLEAALMAMARDDQNWAGKTRVVSKQSGSLLAPKDLLDAIREPANDKSSLDAAIAAVLHATSDGAAKP